MKDTIVIFLFTVFATLFIGISFLSCSTMDKIRNETTCPALEALGVEACKVACKEQDEISDDVCVFLCEEIMTLTKDEIENRIK